MSRPKPVVLAILDGWGLAAANPGNAIALANTPTLDLLTASYPHTQLEAAGEAVGLPGGEDGNTETGHLNLGAGQIVYQDLPRINQAIAEGRFDHNPQFLAALAHTQRFKSRLHLIGLIGSGGVHSSLNHLYALIHWCVTHRLNNVVLHLITDGRDSPPTSAINFLTPIKTKLKETSIGVIGTIIGRYYAMDRDHHWDRTAIAYQALTQGLGRPAHKPEAAILASYQQQITDEFIQPIILVDQQQQPLGLIRDHDAVIFYNFRIDRPRQLTKAFVLPDLNYALTQPEGFDPYAIKYYKSHLPPRPAIGERVFERRVYLKNLAFVTMTEYEKGLPVAVAFPPQTVDMPLGRVVAEMGLRQLRLAETEKERFVTYYFNGQREDPFPGEDRIIIPSPPVATYDQKPEMSSIALTQTLIERVHAAMYDLIVVNYANPDMVGHTGNLQAAIKACEITDTNLMRLTDVVMAIGGVVLITADHGNVEEMINLETNAVDTEHSNNPVPLLIVGNRYQNQLAALPPGILADVAPTILQVMELPQPSTMSGQSRLKSL